MEMEMELVEAMKAAMTTDWASALRHARATLVDVRSAEELAVCGVRGRPVVHMPVHQVLAGPPDSTEPRVAGEESNGSLPECTEDAVIVVFCASGGRSAVAKDAFERLWGFKNVVNAGTVEAVQRAIDEAPGMEVDASDAAAGAASSSPCACSASAPAPDEESRTTSGEDLSPPTGRGRWSGQDAREKKEDREPSESLSESATDHLWLD